MNGAKAGGVSQGSPSIENGGGGSDGAEDKVGEQERAHGAWGLLDSDVNRRHNSNCWQEW